MLLAINWAGGSGKAGLEAEPVAQVSFAAVFLGASPAFGGGGSNGEEGDGVRIGGAAENHGPVAIDFELNLGCVFSRVE